MTMLLQCLRDELMRPYYAATLIRSDLQSVEAFPRAKVDPSQLDPHEGIFEVSFVRA